MKVYVILVIFSLPIFSFGQSDDWRLISNGQKIYEHGYCDQPYIVTTSDGSWVCTFTTSPGKEGDEIQYIVSMFSSDKGKTWSDPVEIEPASSGIEASWAMPLITNFDRVYVFYTFNGEAIRSFPDGTSIRSDTHGWYCYRYSDDKGKTWSERLRLDMRKTMVDHNNDFSGEVQMFWGIGEPVSKKNDVWFSFTKLGKYFLKKGEGWVYHSDNILNERDVSKINWELLPEGDIGIKSPNLGSVQEEFNIQPMNMDSGLYCVYRTTLGQPANAYSYDKGKTWSEPALMNYATGLPLRNPRACPRLWKCENGKYLLWYHNNGEKGFKHRNPAWVSGGIEKNGKIYWSQPEILIHGPDLSYDTGRFSYPDLVEEDGKYWISTTQKTAATIHKIPSDFFNSLWSQFDEPSEISNGIIGKSDSISSNEKLEFTGQLEMTKGGFAFDFWITMDQFENEIIFEGKDSNIKNIELSQNDDGTLGFKMFKGSEVMSLRSDKNRLKKGIKHHVAILIDADAKICYMLIDGSISDGGGEEVFGFSRFDNQLMEFKLKSLLFNKFSGEIDVFRLYGEQMHTSDFVNNYTFEK